MKNLTKTAPKNPLTQPKRKKVVVTKITFTKKKPEMIKEVFEE